MPEGINVKEFENLIKHYSSKQDKQEREFYLKLFDDTKANADLILNTEGKKGEDRKAYIKAYQHKETHDLYYLAVTENNDKIDITGHAITDLMDVVRQIRKSKGLVSLRIPVKPDPIHKN